MRVVDANEARTHLHEVGMAVGEWSQLCDGSGRQYGKSNWIRYQAPRDSRELHNFAQHVAGWLPKGGWKLFQIDNSTSPSEDEAFLIQRLLFGPGNAYTIAENRSLVFEFAGDSKADLKEDLLLSNLVFLFLLFECHGQVVSSGCREGKHLSIQDGFVYFMSFDGNDIGIAQDLLNGFEEQPLRAPQY